MDTQLSLTIPAARLETWRRAVIDLVAEWSTGIGGERRKVEEARERRVKEHSHHGEALSRVNLEGVEQSLAEFASLLPQLPHRDCEQDTEFHGSRETFSMTAQEAARICIADAAAEAKVEPIDREALQSRPAELGFWLDLCAQFEAPREVAA